MKPDKKIIRCAIYTRKSHEEGLDMDYNTLDAQRDAGEKYIEAMRGEGWQVLPQHYDDGGFTGGNMERPALKQLIRDIKANKIDIVVVYKIDRLSRSLVDFARLMEVFDEHEASFVSVTQHFNTKDSMGRLTMNILLSFAQFEREVTGERIRDKFASSKKKGMWMGGPLPLGYDVVNRKLRINKPEAQLVQHIFERYITLKSVTLLARELNDAGFTMKKYISKNGNPKGGGRFTPNNLRKLLQNHIYIGEIHHKGEYFPGEHQGIIGRDVFEMARQIKKEPAHIKRKRTKLASSKALLKDIIVCGCCESKMSPTYTHKKGRKYHYYVINSHRRNAANPCPLPRIPAGEIESVVGAQLQKLFESPEILIKVWQNIKEKAEKFSEEDLHNSLHKLHPLWDKLFPAEKSRIARLLIEKVRVNRDGITIQYRKTGIEQILAELQHG